MESFLALLVPVAAITGSIATAIGTIYYARRHKDDRLEDKVEDLERELRECEQHRQELLKENIAMLRALAQRWDNGKK